MFETVKTAIQKRESSLGGIQSVQSPAEALRKLKGALLMLVAATCFLVSLGFSSAADAETLTVRKSPSAIGSISSNPTGITCVGSLDCSSDSHNFPRNTRVTLTIRTYSGYYIGSVSGCDSQPSLPSAREVSCVVTMSRNKTVSVSFRPNPTLSVTLLGNRGYSSVVSNPYAINCPTTGCSAPFAINSRVTLTARPSYGHVFVRWGGSCTGSGTSTTISLTTFSRSCTATFARAS